MCIPDQDCVLQNHIGNQVEDSWEWLRLGVARASLIAQLVNNPPVMQGTLVQFLGWEDPLEKG